MLTTLKLVEKLDIMAILWLEDTRGLESNPMREKTIGTLVLLSASEAILLGRVLSGTISVLISLAGAWIVSLMFLYTICNVRVVLTRRLLNCLDQ